MYWLKTTQIGSLTVLEVGVGRGSHRAETGRRQGCGPFGEGSVSLPLAAARGCPHSLACGLSLSSVFKASGLAFSAWSL